MPSLADTLGSIPGYAGFQASRARNQQQEQGELQQAVALQGLVAKQQAMQEEAILKSVVAQAGGDPAKATEALMKAGTPRALELATKLKALQPKPAEPYTLGPDQVRYDGAGNPIAFGLPKPEPKPPAAEPLHPILKDGKPVLVPRSQAVGATPYSPSIAGVGELEPDTLKQVAEQYLAGDRQAIQGYARNAKAKAALQNEIAKQAKKKGWSGADIAAQMADFAGTVAGSRTVGQRAAQIALAATEAEKMIPVAEEASKKFSRSSFVPANIALKAYQENTGAPEIKAFGAALNSLVNVYARAISPSGVPTVSDKDHAREMISTIHSPEQFAAVMDIIRQELKIAKAAPAAVRDATRASVSGTPAPEAPNPAPAADPMKAAAEAAWGSYDPAKYEYRMNNGRPQRKAK